MEYRTFGQTGMRLSTVAMGGLLARYEGRCGKPSPEEKHRIYLRAAELGINLFDMGYGDEAHIPDELKGNHSDRHFALKTGPQTADALEPIVDKHLANLRRDTLDVLRLHHKDFVGIEGLAERVSSLRQSGKIRSLCLIRHHLEDQQAYAQNGPCPDADADLVVYNYVCRKQEPGLEMSRAAGKGVLIMKALGGQWLGWENVACTDWKDATEETIVELAPAGEDIRRDLKLIHPIVSGPWQELAEPGESVPRTARAVSWVLQNPAVSSVLVAVASVEELEQVVADG